MFRAKSNTGEALQLFSRTLEKWSEMKGGQKYEMMSFQKRNYNNNILRVRKHKETRNES